MKTLISTLLCFIVSLTFGQKIIEPEAPVEKYTIEKMVTKQTSTINIPFNLTMTEVENQINKSITGLIYEDNSYTDNDNDNFKCRVWKKNKIIFTGVQGNVFDYSVPLKIWAEKGIGALGFMSYQSTEFEMILKFSSTFGIQPDWSFQTITNANGFDWITKPAIKIGGVDVPITAVIGKIISNNHAMFARKIDESVKSNINIRPYVLKAWETASQPFLISEEYKTWLKVTPLDISMAPLVTVNKVIQSTINLKVITETNLGEKPIITKSPLPNLKIAPQKESTFDMAILNEVPYVEATAIAKKMFVGQKYEFQDGKFKTEILGIDIYGSEDKLVIKADMKGSVKGTIFMKGIPVYDSTKKMIVLSNLDYDLKTKNVLVKAANWMIEGKLAKMFESKFGMPLTDLMKMAKTNVEETLSKPLSKGIKMDGEIQEIMPNKIYLTPTSMVIVVKTKGKLSLKIDGID